MSTFAAYVLPAQRKLQIPADGVAGQGTWTAIARALGVSLADLPLIEAVQRKLGLGADGIAGPVTWGAIAHALGIPAETLAEPAAGAVPDTQSEKHIATLLPEVQPLARALVRLCGNEGITLKVTSGTRTYAEQNELFAQGRNALGQVLNKREVVTNARGGFSNHNFGIAFDVTIFRGGVPVWEDPLYRQRVADIGKSLGLTWGGDWKTIQDEPHFEYRPRWAASFSESAMLAELRRRRAAGLPLL